MVPGRGYQRDLLAELIDDSWHQVVNKLSKRRSSACVRADFQPNAIKCYRIFTLIILRSSLYSSSPERTGKVL